MNNPFATARQNSKTHPNDDRIEKQRTVEALWESYKTYALLECNPNYRTALQSPEAQLVNIGELLRCRRLFWGVPESLTIDPARPATLALCEAAAKAATAKIQADIAAQQSLEPPTRVSIVKA
jgi:hypothetical protein